MRTTVTLDADVFSAAKSLAAEQRISLGAAISALVRRALTPPPSQRKERNGVPLLPLRPGPTAPVTLTLVNQLRDTDSAS